MSRSQISILRRGQNPVKISPQNSPLVVDFDINYFPRN